MIYSLCRKPLQLCGIMFHRLKGALLSMARYFRSGRVHGRVSSEPFFFLSDWYLRKQNLGELGYGLTSYTLCAYYLAHLCAAQDRDSNMTCKLTTCLKTGLFHLSVPQTIPSICVTLNPRNAILKEDRHVDRQYALFGCTGNNKSCKTRAKY